MDVAVSPKKAALNEIKNRIVDYKEGLLATVEMGLAEILEINIPSSFEDKVLMDLTLPKRAVIAIIQRGSRVIIPKGQTPPISWFVNSITSSGVNIFAFYAKKIF